ncbi:patatin-like phospholipase family protein [Dactylosporangium sp. NPDC005572]|uniref:patatin-like phospholipase family protein n=1 Tax=Dactylosporangium sp. NPDC005572 TaxID=3156889 RepID=UPI0033AF2672
MSTYRRSHPRRRFLAAAAVLAAGLPLLAACGSSSSDTAQPASTAASATPARPRVGIILGGGGETGIAWQTGVLAALQDKAGLTPDVVDVVVGTSAGAFTGAAFSSKADLHQLVTNEKTGNVKSAPVTPGATGAIPPQMLAALTSTEGTIEERDKRIGALAMSMKLPITSAELVGYVATMLPTTQWPALDFRATTVNAETGKTVLWKSTDGVPLPAAVASSAAVPGFLPTVEINGQHYTDAPRTTYSAALVAEKRLDAIIYIGMPTPNLSNTIEEDALKQLETNGLKVVRITGGPGSEDVIKNALDPKFRPKAVEIGLNDGTTAADNVTKLLQH